MSDGLTGPVAERSAHLRGFVGGRGLIRLGVERLPTVPGDTEYEFDDIGLDPDTTYTYAVTASADVDVSEAVTVEATTDADA